MNSDWMIDPIRRAVEASMITDKEVKLLQFGVLDAEDLLRLQTLRVNENYWEAPVALMELIAPEGYEFVIRKVGHEISVIRRKVAE